MLIIAQTQVNIAASVKNNLFSAQLSGSHSECVMTGTENWASFMPPAQYPLPTPGWKKHWEKPTEYMNECGSEWQIKEPELPKSTVYILRPYHSSVRPPFRSACVCHTLPGWHLEQDGSQNDSDIVPAFLGRLSGLKKKLSAMSVTVHSNS